MTKPNRAKKAERMKRKEEVTTPNYVLVERVPHEGKKAYTKLVSLSKAITLLKGKLRFDFAGKPYVEKLSREFRLA